MEILHPLSSSLPSPPLFALCRYSAFTFTSLKSLAGVSSLPLSVGLIDGQPLPSALCASLSFGKPLSCTLLLFCKYASVFLGSGKINRKDKQIVSLQTVFCVLFALTSYDSSAGANGFQDSTKSLQPESLCRILLTLLYTLITNHESQILFILQKKPNKISIASTIFCITLHYVATCMST